MARPQRIKTGMRHKLKEEWVCASLSMLSKLHKTHVQPKAHRGPQSTNVKSTYIKTLRATRYREHMVYLLHKYCEIHGEIKILILQTWKEAKPSTWVITPTPAPSKACQ